MRVLPASYSALAIVAACATGNTSMAAATSAALRLKSLFMGVPFLVVRKSALTPARAHCGNYLSQPPHHQQHDDDDQHQSQPANGPIAPAAAVRPGWKG